MTTRREVLITGAAIATSLLAACSGEPEAQPSGPVEVPKADVPVGGGLVLADARVVVVQPEEGTFLAYSAVCTHQHCIVREVRPEGIHCACHGSLFDTSDGSPIEGPATTPLPAAAVEDTGDLLVVTT